MAKGGSGTGVPDPVKQTPPATDRLPWRELWITLLLPTVIFGAGTGILAIAIPIVALDTGASFAAAAVIAAMLQVGQMAATLPAGRFVDRFSEKTAMVVSSLLSSAAAFGAFVISSPVLLGVCMFVAGAGAAVFALARHAWITTSVSRTVRGRTMAVVAGGNRLGQFAGPFIAAAVFSITDRPGAAFAAAAVTFLAGILVILAAKFPQTPRSAGSSSDRGALAIMWVTRGMLLRLGSVVSLIGTARIARRIVVPLVGIAIGLDEVTVALVVGVAAGVDASLFYVGGIITDRFGRLWVAVPALLGFGISFLILAAYPYISGAAAWFVLATIIMSIGNGISSGVVQTIGSDLADLANTRRPALFLSAWRLTVELGGTLAPLIVASITTAASLSVAVGSIGGLSLLGASLLPRLLNRYLPRTARKARIVPAIPPALSIEDPRHCGAASHKNS